jgi:Flp pilus assembly protein TadD
VLALLTLQRSRLYAKPEALWRDAVANQPTNARALSSLGAVLSNLPVPRITEADSLFRQAILVDSSYADAWYNLAMHQMQRGEHASAAANLSRVVQIHPGDAQALSILGTAYLKLGRPADADSAFRRALSLNPNDRNAREGLARVSGHDE